MMNSRTVVESLSPLDLRSATHELVQTSCGVDAAILVHLGEIDERKLYLDWRFSSMFAFCVGRAEVVRGHRMQPDRSCPCRTTAAGHPGCALLGAGAHGRTALAGAASDSREPGNGIGGGRWQVEAPVRRARRATVAAAARSDDRAQAAGSLRA